MQCADARNWLFRKIDGELSDSEIRALDDHLAQCVSCAREYGLFALPRQIAQATPEIAPSPFFYQKLKARIDGETREIAGWLVFWRLARQVVPALAGITLALLSVLAYFQLHSPEANFYRAYERILVTEEQPRQMLAAEQGDITDVSVLSAIAERESNHQHHK
jgi:anti-sigma factor RsiW